MSIYRVNLIRGSGGFKVHVADMAEFDQSIRQEPERPAAPTCWRVPTGQGDEVGLLVAIKQPRPAIR